MNEMTLLASENKSSIYGPNQLSSLNLLRIPSHIALIPDGNRRWAKKRASQSEKGHQEGADRLLTMIRACQEIGIRSVTVYSFSTENWSRSQEEIEALMVIYANYLLNNCEEMVQRGIKLETIGDLSRLPPQLRQIITETKAATHHCTEINLILALNYGSRDDLCRTFKIMAEDMKRGQLLTSDITEEAISSYLDTAEWGDPELLIRTSGEQRLSNFLSWQLCYAEIYISQVLWPDFTPYHLLEAIIDYQSRDRRWGGA